MEELMESKNITPSPLNYSPKEKFTKENWYDGAFIGYGPRIALKVGNSPGPG